MMASAAFARLAGSPMRRLMLLRHAKTETDAPSGRDFDRRLDARGIADAGQIGHWLAQQDVLPVRVLVSPAARARMTWDIVAAILPTTLESIEIDSLYNATPNDLMRAVHDHGANATPLLVIAHNPGLQEIAIGMTGSSDPSARRMLDDNLPTCGLITLDFDAATWDGAGIRRGHLVEIVSPKSLMQGGA